METVCVAGIFKFFVACYQTIRMSWPRLEDITAHLIREEVTRRPKQPVEHQFFVWEECKQLT